MRLRREHPIKSKKDSNDNTCIYIVGVIITVIVLLFFIFGPGNKKTSTKIYATQTIGQLTPIKMSVPITEGSCMNII